MTKISKRRMTKNQNKVTTDSSMNYTKEKLKNSEQNTGLYTR